MHNKSPPCPNLLLGHLHFCTTVRDADLEDGCVRRADNRKTLRLVLYHEAAGINGRVCVHGLYREHKVAILRAGWGGGGVSTQFIVCKESGGTVLSCD